jgi:hypothetical protein
MPLLTLRRLSYWVATASLGVACATYEAPPKASHSNSEAGAPDSGSGNTGANGGSSAGTFSTGGTTAGTDTTGAGNGTGASAGTSAAGAAAGGEPATGGASEGGSPGAAGENAVGVGGMPDPGCSAPADCDDKNPCTTDDCVDTVCQYTNNTEPCADDADDCTDDVCAAGLCTHPANTAPCEDDNDACTKDLCAGDICTHPDNGTCACQKAADCNDSNPCTTDKCIGNQCQYTNNSLGCIDDKNPCTDDVCQAGACMHGNNAASCTDDGDACTGDICAGGSCTHPAVAGCCSGDGDCYDANVCTDDSCVNNKCVHASNTVTCAGDSNPCTSDTCAAGSCKHSNNSVCAGADDIVIFVNRTKGYVVMNGSNVDWTGTNADTAEIFEKVGESGTKFKLRSKSTGLYVTLTAGDVLVATADQAGGMLFDAPTCGAAPWVGLNATSDTNGGTWVQAATGNHLISQNGDCSPLSATAWEKFQLMSVTVPCTKLADCDDGNACTDEVCGASGYCTYSDHAGTCPDDASTCTDEVCDTGTCFHNGNGTCPGVLVAIQANRNGLYVVLNGATSYLEYTGATVGTAGVFEQVDKVGTQFKLRASNGMFVALDVNDNLIANAAFAGATLFDSPACDVKSALVALNDDDAQRFVAAEAANRLIAKNGGCPAANAGAWEKFSILPQ